MPAADAFALAQWIDPERAFAAVAGEASAFWLDAGPDAVAGWSWVGTGRAEPDPQRVREVDVSAAPAPVPGATPFRGGWVGWLDYDSAARRAGASAAAPEEPERGVWVRVERFLAFDHAARRVWAVGADAAALAERAAAAPPPHEPAAAPTRRAHARHTPDQYAALIEQARTHIRDGDAYLLCLTTRFSVPGAVDPWEAYRRLRRVTPSHHGGFLRSGDTTLASATPERFLHISGGVVRTHPIKGTRPRHPDPARDRALAGELRADVKERAENVMIVDLMRNDLSRVSAPGTVAVDRLLEVESYPAVHQLVSTVSGALAASTTLGDVLDAAFPAGSMTGAPKLSAMSILHELEAAPRGMFAGCFGWVGDDGAADLAMVIRSIVTTPDGASVAAGGGITWRSEAADEVAEVGIKARAPLAALGASLPSGWSARVG